MGSAQSELHGRLGGALRPARCAPPPVVPRASRTRQSGEGQSPSGTASTVVGRARPSSPARGSSPA